MPPMPPSPEEVEARRRRWDPSGEEKGDEGALSDVLASNEVPKTCSHSFIANNKQLMRTFVSDVHHLWYVTPPSLLPSLPPSLL